MSDDGWDVEIIESALRQAVPHLAFLIPEFHNPTGLLMPDEARGRVLSAAHRAGTWLVVDETLADLALDVPAPAPFACRAAPDEASRVITVGSMSKSHWGGLRIGWLRASAQLVTELAAQHCRHRPGRLRAGPAARPGAARPRGSCSRQLGDCGHGERRWPRR